jgi:hypothetical protein
MQMSAHSDRGVNAMTGRDQMATTTRTLSTLAVGAITLAIAVVAPGTIAHAAQCQVENKWCTVPSKDSLKGSAAVVKNDHSAHKAAGKIYLKNKGTKCGYISWRPSGSRFGTGRAAWTGGPKVCPGGTNDSWWDYYYYPVLQPYAFEFRICTERRGPDSCGSKLTIKDPKNSPF